MKQDFVQMAINKLCYEMRSIPFKFLDIPFGANPKRFSTWSPIISSSKKKLSLCVTNLFPLLDEYPLGELRKVYRSKEGGELGIKNMILFNLALLEGLSLVERFSIYLANNGEDHNSPPSPVFAYILWTFIK
ncbi:hypothetical protein Lal_00040225 [Lupinus albus]|nr:hypothetical protein Lal_00040225 [Lupinus albus]